MKRNSARVGDLAEIRSGPHCGVLGRVQSISGCKVDLACVAIEIDYHDQSYSEREEETILSGIDVGTLTWVPQPQWLLNQVAALRAKYDQWQAAWHGPRGIPDPSIRVVKASDLGLVDDWAVGG